MNAPTTAAATARPDDYQEEARNLVEWLLIQAALYRKHAPACAGDIQAFEDAAALIDTFRAGLALVDPHPAMRAELVRWVSMEDALPPVGRCNKLILWGPDEGCIEIAYLSKGCWRDLDGVPLRMDSFTHWAFAPTGPAPVQPIEDRHEEAQP